MREICRPRSELIHFLVPTLHFQLALVSDAVQEGSTKELRRYANWIYIHETSGGSSPKEG
jgi:hypothetical protein